MPSISYDTWIQKRLPELDEIAVAHAAIGGTGRGRRYATQQINYAYTALISSQFQGFCRDLHTESIDHIIQATTSGSMHSILSLEFVFGRKLDRGNPTPGNIGADFGRLGVRFWHQAKALDRHTPNRLKRLEHMNVWRNAIAHHDFTHNALNGRRNLRLREVQGFRSACEHLARTFDHVMRDYIHNLTGQRPWN